MLNAIKKIKVLHLLTVPQHLRERKSVREIIALCNDDQFDYYQAINKPYEDVPPSHNVLFGNSHWVLGKNKPKGPSKKCGLTSGHYGCFIAHRDAIIQFIKQDMYRWLLIVECDCKILDESISTKIKESVKFMSSSDCKIFTFGRTDDFPVPVYEDICESNSLFGTQMYLLDRYKADYYKRLFDTYGWHTIDLWYNEVFKIEKEKVLCRKQILASQYHKEFSLSGGNFDIYAANLENDLTKVIRKKIFKLL